MGTWVFEYAILSSPSLLIDACWPREAGPNTMDPLPTRHRDEMSEKALLPYQRVHAVSLAASRVGHLRIHQQQILSICVFTFWRAQLVGLVELPLTLSMENRCNLLIGSSSSRSVEGWRPSSSGPKR